MIQTKERTALATPLRWWSPRQRELLLLAVERACRAWEQQWGIAGPAGGSSGACELAWVLGGQDDEWVPLPAAASDGGTAAWWQLPSDPYGPDRIVAQALYGAPAIGGALGDAAGLPRIARATAAAARHDFWLRIAEVLQTPGAAPQRTACDARAHWFQSWSGAVVLSLPWCEQPLRILVGGDAVEAFLRQRHALPAPVAARAPLVPLWEALAPLASRVRAELAPVELSLGAVQALRVGDVIEFAHALDAPLLAKTADGELLCQAFLGKSGGHRAIELLRAPALSS